MTRDEAVVYVHQLVEQNIPPRHPAYGNLQDVLKVAAEQIWEAAATVRKKYPRRKYEICIEVDGHTFQDALLEMQRQADHIESHGELCASVGGGGSSGHIVTIDIHPTMTPEQWEKDLEAFMETRRKPEDTK